MIEFMNHPHLLIYGIPNCDTVKKARAWLTEHGHDAQFHDFKKLGVPHSALELWIQALGWEALVNRQGTTWRKLTPEAQSGVTNAIEATKLMLTQPSVIKRPVIDWGENASPRFTVGFKPAEWHHT
jgi:Spx/MgsR family transcriptional regulator